PPLIPTLFPYTTLFRSGIVRFSQAFKRPSSTFDLSNTSRVPSFFITTRGDSSIRSNVVKRVRNLRIPGVSELHSSHPHDANPPLLNSYADTLDISYDVHLICNRLVSIIITPKAINIKKKAD